METLFNSRLVKRALTGELDSPLGAIDQNYVAEAHWRKLVVCFYEKVVYYFEPYGSPMRAGHRVRKAFDDSLGALADGWEFRSVEVKLQTDGCSCSCGVWVLVVSRAFVAYVDSSEFGVSA